MRQFAALLLVGLVVGCAGQNSGPVADGQGGNQPARLAAAPLCRLSPDGGPVLAERGIGGTGAPAATFTSAAAGSVQVADRGIGGTGIVGVITGFASVCVNGLEVTYNDTVPVALDGAAIPVSALRVGQVVVIQAEGPAAAPYARTMALRQEVSGRIEAVELGSGLLTVAGMPVSVPSETWGASRFGLGDWVTVSGLPRPDGVVVATRLDVAPQGVFSVHGRIAQDGTTASIGRLTLPSQIAGGVQDGQPVVVTGVYTQGRKQATGISPDKLSADPASYFGPSVNHLVMQAFIRVAPGAVWLNGRKIAASPNLRGVPGSDGLAVVSLERGPDGSFSASELRAADLRVRGAAAASSSRASNLGSTPSSVTRHVSLTPPRPDAAGVGALTNYQPATTAPSVATIPATISQPVPVLPQAGSPSTSVGTMPSVPASIAVAPANPPIVTAVPSLTSPVATGAIPLISPPPLTMPSVAAGSLPAMIPAPIPAVATPPATVQAPPPVVPPVGVPQVESVYAPLISSNDGATAVPSAASARNGPGAVLASQAVHARSLPGSTNRPTISLVTTTGVPNPAVPAAAAGVLSALRTSPAISTLTSGRAGRH